MESLSIKKPSPGLEFYIRKRSMLVLDLLQEYSRSISNQYRILRSRWTTDGLQSALIASWNFKGLSDEYIVSLIYFELRTGFHSVVCCMMTPLCVIGNKVTICAYLKMSQPESTDSNPILFYIQKNNQVIRAHFQILRLRPVRHFRASRRCAARPW